MAESAERERAWQQQADAWAVEHEQWQDELLSLANARQQLATRLEQRQSELQTEVTRWQTECDELRADRQQQLAAQEIERQQWQQEMASLANARQQLEAEFEQRQAERQTAASRWQTKCEALHVDWQRQQAAWAEERTQLLEESQRQKDEAAQNALQAVTRREQELAEQTQTLLTERQQIEAERLQLQSARLDSEQTLADLSAERQRLEDRAVEVQSKSDELTRHLAEFEQQQAQLARDQQVLEHSQNWVQSDRRKLVEEKTQWQQQATDRQVEREAWKAESELQRLQLEELEKTRGRWREERDETQHHAAKRDQLTAERDQLTVERDQLTAEREQFAAERLAWSRQCEQAQSELQDNATKLETAYAELQAQQQQTLQDEQHRLQLLHADWEARTAEVQIEREAVDSERQASSEIQRAWEDDRSTWESDLPPARPQPPTFAEEPLRSLTDDWSIGVDLTAPRETPGVDPLIEPATNSDWPVASWTQPLAETTSLDRVGANEDFSPAAEWESPSRPNDITDISDTEVSQPPALESLPETAADRPLSAMKTLDFDVAALRAELAEKFQLPGLRETLPASSVVDEPTDSEPAMDELAASEPTDSEPTVTEPAAVESTVAESDASPNSGASIGDIGSLAFSEDEPIDDSVSRYMQHLLARSQKPGDNGGERFASTSTRNAPATERPQPSHVAAPIKVAEFDITDESSSSDVESPSNAKLRALQAEPAHKQDKDAIRAATERMRQVANQQTLNIVQASNSSRLKRSLKTKSCLAAFSFVLSAGLLFLGYSSQPDFVVLSVCAAGLGVMTWVDLFFAIREARRRTSQLAGRKKKA